MKKHTKIFVSFILILSIILACVVFMTFPNNVTYWRDCLNNVTNTNNQLTEISTSNFNKNEKLQLINSPGMGKYKINFSTSDIPGYENIDISNIASACNKIINSNNKVNIIASSNNINAEMLCAYLQMLAGDDFDHIKKTFISHFKDTTEDQIINTMNVAISSDLAINVKDVPYINLTKYANKYFQENGLSTNEVNELTNKIKEDCD